MMTLGLDFFEREKTGRLVVAHDVRRRRAAGARAGRDHVDRAERAALRRRGDRDLRASWQLALVHARRRAPGRASPRGWFRRESNQAYLEVRERIGHNLATLQEGLAGVRVVQAFGREERVLRAASRRPTRRSSTPTSRRVRIATRYFPFVEFLGVGGDRGDHRPRRGASPTRASSPSARSPRSCSTSTTCSSRCSSSASTTTRCSRRAPRSRSCSGCSTTAPSIAERPGAVDLPATARSRCDDVSFGYADGADVLHDVTLDDRARRAARAGRADRRGQVDAGEADGRGSTTRATARCAFGGVDLRDATIALAARAHRRGAAGGVPVRGHDPRQHPHRAARRHRCRGRRGGRRARPRASGSSALPDGLDTEVRERGSRLSAGERQLVSLARAALADPAVLVLDEATSNLDPGTEHAVELALERLTEHRTVVVVAHRLSTAARADRVGGGRRRQARRARHPRRAVARGRALRRAVRVVVGSHELPRCSQPRRAARRAPASGPSAAMPSRIAGIASTVPECPKCRLTIEPAATVASVRCTTASAPGSS